MLTATADARDKDHGMSAPDMERASAARVGMVGLIVAEASLFAVFVVAYLYDLGRSLSGPTPREVLSVPVLGTVCLLSSSAAPGSWRRYCWRSCSSPAPRPSGYGSSRGTD